MAEMEFSGASKKIGDVTTTALAEGGGVAIGFLGAGIVGKQIEKVIKPNVVKTSPVIDKAIAWAANNVPKVAVWYGIKKVNKMPGGKPSNLSELMMDDAKKATIASVVFDTLVRASNGGAPGTTVKLFGIDVLSGQSVADNTEVTTQLQNNLQRLVQENSTLRSQLNQALGKMASAPTPTPSPLAPPADHDRAWSMMQTPEAVERRKQFGTMESEAPAIAERNKRFSQMSRSQLNFAGDVEASSAYGML